MITKADATDSGCWIDGHWGQYGIARMVEIAQQFGYDDEFVTSLADLKLATMQINTHYYMTDDEEEALYEASDAVEEWLNENVAPEGYAFGWHDGEFFLWSDYDWREPEMGHWE